MRLVLDSDPTVLTVASYSPGEIVIGEQRVRRPCIISAQQLILDWPALSPLELTEAMLQPILQLRPLIVLFGTGTGLTQQLAPATVRRDFYARGIALECMNLGAACRTYNVLVQENRPVVAGLFPN